MKRELRNLMRHVIVAAPLLVLLSAANAAAADDDAADIAGVLEVQAQRFQAMTTANTNALNQILADDLVYVHTTGAVDSKSSLVASIGSGAIDYVSLSPTETQVRIHGAIAIVTGIAAMQVVAAATEHILSVRFTDVYLRADDGWQLVSWQSTRIP